MRFARFSNIALCALCAACGGTSTHEASETASRDVELIEPLDLWDAEESPEATLDTSPDAIGPWDTEAVDELGPDTADLENSADSNSPTCADAPLPFPMPTAESPWRSLNSELTTTLGPANHRGQDVIVREGQPQVLIAKFAYSFLDKDLIDEDVEVWMQRDVPCGVWELLGTYRTSEDGEYGETYGIEDDGGRVFVEIPTDKRFPVGRYPVRMVLGGDLSVASFDLIVVAEGTQAIVTDIDGTLTTGDDQLITEIAFSIFDGTYVQEAYPDGDRMLETWADKGYLIVYMTGRPDFLRPMTERWVEPRFPPGPMHLTDTNGQALPTNDGVGAYKVSYIEYLESQGIDIVAAYGNATTDIFAYLGSGLPADRVFIIGKHAGEDGTVPLSGGYTDHLPWVEARPEATIKAPPAYGWW